jgi:hypothetical protein
VCVPCFGLGPWLNSDKADLGFLQSNRIESSDTESQPHLAVMLQSPNLDIYAILVDRVGLVLEMNLERLLPTLR